MKRHNPTGRDDSADRFIKKLRRRWYIVSAVIITLWAAWTLLDAFVIPRDILSIDEIAEAVSPEGEAAGDEAADAPIDDEPTNVPLESEPEDAPADTPTDAPIDDEPADEPTEAPIEIPDVEPTEEPVVPIVTDNSYFDGDVSIEINYMRTLDTDVYIADVSLSDPSRLRTALAGDAFGRNLTETTSSIAERNDAIFAVNGDYYGFRSTGYVMRGGYLYRDVISKDPEQEDLVLYDDGSFKIIREADMTAQEIADTGATDIFSFGPGLVMDGEISVTRDDEVERAQVTNPRTAIGVVSPLHYLFVVSDGRTDESIGLSLYELAELMKELGCTSAYNLDGGGSSTIWFNGQVLNRPTTFGDEITERSISDIVYIGK